MKSRDVRVVIAIAFFIGFGICGNYIAHVYQSDNLAALAYLIGIVSVLYVGIDVWLATETSLLYRINKWWADVGLYRSGALLLIIVFLIVGWMYVRQLFSTVP